MMVKVAQVLAKLKTEILPPGDVEYIPAMVTRKPGETHTARQQPSVCLQESFEHGAWLQSGAVAWHGSGAMGAGKLGTHSAFGCVCGSSIRTYH